jgi:hypothetical protein
MPCHWFPPHPRSLMLVEGLCCHVRTFLLEERERTPFTFPSPTRRSQSSTFLFQNQWQSQTIYYWSKTRHTHVCWASSSRPVRVRVVPVSAVQNTTRSVQLALGPLLAGFYPCVDTPIKRTTSQMWRSLKTKEKYMYTWEHLQVWVHLAVAKSNLLASLFLSASTHVSLSSTIQSHSTHVVGLRWSPSSPTFSLIWPFYSHPIQVC